MSQQTVWSRSARRSTHTVAVALLCALAATPRAATAEVISLPDLVGSAGEGLKVAMAAAEYDAAYADWERARSEQGWKLAIGAGYGQQRDLIDESRSRDFEAIRTEVKLAYPLLGAHAKVERDIEMASGKVAEARIGRDGVLKLAQLQIEDVYAALWGAQESLEVIAAYLSATRDTETGGNSEARKDQRRLARRRDDARARLEQLTGRKLEGLVVTGVQLPQMPTLDPRRLEQDHPELAALRAQYLSARTQLDGSVWYGIDAGFDLTQSTIQDRDGGQAGSGLFANFTVVLPVTFYQAGLAERSKLRAEMQFLELKIKDKSGEIVERAQGTEAEYLDLADEVDTVTQKTRAAAQALRNAGAGAQALRDYYQRALAEIDARTRYWRSHVAMRSFVPVGAAEPAPEMPGPTVSDVGTRLAEPLLRLGS